MSSVPGNKAIFLSQQRIQHRLTGRTYALDHAAENDWFSPPANISQEAGSRLFQSGILTKGRDDESKDFYRVRLSMQGIAGLDRLSFRWDSCEWN